MEGIDGGAPAALGVAYNWPCPSDAQQCPVLGSEAYYNFTLTQDPAG